MAGDASGEEGGVGEWEVGGKRETKCGGGGWRRRNRKKTIPDEGKNKLFIL